jgi:hypothetical protein
MKSMKNMKRSDWGMMENDSGMKWSDSSMKGSNAGMEMGAPGMQDMKGSDAAIKGRDAGMKKAGAIVGAIALTFAVGSGLIFGNAALAAQTMAKEPSAAPATRTSATAAKEASAEGPAGIAGAERESAAQGGAGRETGNQDGVSTIMKTLENGTTVIVEYYYDEGGAKAAVTHKYADGQATVNNYEGETAEAAIERFGGPKRNMPDRYVKAQPGEGNVKETAAINSAIEAIAVKYALKQETLGMFSVTPVFYSKYEDVPSSVWWIGLYPANADDFSDIGCYTAILNGDTGETIRLLSAADGKG